MAKLGNFFTIASGGTPDKRNPSYYENGTIPWVKTGDLKNQYVPAGIECITEEGLNNSSAKLFPPNTVLVAMYGATIGACSILTYEAATNQACAAFLPNKNVLPTYLYYFLSSKREQFVKDGVGGAQPNISAGYLKNVQFGLIPMQQQIDIVEKLDKVEKLIVLRKEQLAKLDQLVKSRFIELFGMPGADDFGWGLMPLGSICYINPKKGQDPRLSSGVEVSFVPMPAVTERGEIDATAVKEYDEVKTGFTYFAENDVLFAKITPCMENGKGAVARGLHNGLGFGSTEFHVLRPISGKSNPYWIYTLTAFSQFREDAASNMTGSAGQRRVPASFLENYRVAVPPIERQEQFAAFVEQTDKSKLAIQQSLDKLELLKKSLMQKYFG